LLQNTEYTDQRASKAGEVEPIATTSPKLTLIVRGNDSLQLHSTIQDTSRSGTSQGGQNCLLHQTMSPVRKYHPLEDSSTVVIEMFKTDSSKLGSRKTIKMSSELLNNSLKLQQPYSS
jgi:hypothetical protein